MTHEGSEDLGNHVSKFWYQLQRFNNMMLKRVDIINFQEDTKNEMKNLKYSMEEKIEQKKEQLQKSMAVMLINALDVRLSNSDNVTQENHENKYTKI